MVPGQLPSEVIARLADGSKGVSDVSAMLQVPGLAVETGGSTLLSNQRVCPVNEIKASFWLDPSCIQQARLSCNGMGNR